MPRALKYRFRSTMAHKSVQVPVATKELHDWRTGGAGPSLIFFNSVGHQ